ncbi:SDR family NAD(P)-dependent oxidoreductase [Streptococcus macacae]|uniref:KR domain protein n=1 Tax=Streptococcus macacae NCTC 11558 TaxID=764298 RepID=G5JYU3_9STRE|nr:SDR family NAD(P)-dependent oxidoreductase [Streptococcus macacae]EHJ52604.1 KR domain protein [Streptococcus macacae NCTC 11558]SUN78200.1 short chain dehydrogenase [Streptococcus macacae NCTC 11558]
MSNNYSLITGASSGIGQATAELFASKGRNLILVARRLDRLEELKKDLLNKYEGLDIVTVKCDLTDIEKLYSFYDSLKEYNINTWINNAGIGLLGEVKDNSLGKVENMLKLNVEAVTILSTLYVQDYADAEGAQLINIASAAGYIVSPSATTYCATKFFVTSFTEGLAQELQANGAKLKAKVLAPSATSTEFAAIATDRTDYAYFEVSNTSTDVAAFLEELYQSHQTVGYVDYSDLSFSLSGPKFQSLYSQ